MLAEMSVFAAGVARLGAFGAASEITSAIAIAGAHVERVVLMSVRPHLFRPHYVLRVTSQMYSQPATSVFILMRRSFSAVAITGWSRSARSSCTHRDCGRCRVCVPVSTGPIGCPPSPNCERYMVCDFVYCSSLVAVQVYLHDEALHRLTMTAATNPHLTVLALPHCVVNQMSLSCPSLCHISGPLRHFGSFTWNSDTNALVNMAQHASTFTRNDSIFMPYRVSAAVAYPRRNADERARGRSGDGYGGYQRSCASCMLATRY